MPLLRASLWIGCILIATAPARAQTTISFNRDVRPILSEFCFSCHGPDAVKRKAKLDLSSAEGAREALGDIKNSEVLARLVHPDPAKRMPPASFAKAPSPAQIARLREWIAAGSPFEKHWAFLPPVRPKHPEVKQRDWCRNPLDHFVLHRLEKEGLRPSPEADRTTLLRRVSLDLTGVPPTPEEVDAFRNDTSIRAYEKVVDRLLASPRFGERMAHRWLDAARYADTNGYQTDGPRTMWRWRDWVIDAFNANMSFDRFTVEQLAGDLLPNPTLEQRIATGFNRNHRGNSEGGIIPEEYAVEYVVDRVDTTATVWLGLTAGCAKCHDHKYDPIRQNEFYRLFAYFNNVPERGKAIKYGNSPPVIRSPTREQQKHLRLLESQRFAAEKTWTDLQPAVTQAQQAWERSFTATGPIEWTYSKGLVGHLALNARGAPTPQETPHTVDAKLGDFGFFDKFSIGVWVRADAGQEGPLVSRMADTDRADGYALLLTRGKVHVHLVKRWLDDAIRLETQEELTPGAWHHVLFSYDGSRTAAGVRVYLDGRPAKLKVHLDDLNQSFTTREPFRVAAGGGQRFWGNLSELRIFDHVVAPEDVGVLASPESVAHALAIPAEKRTPRQAYQVRTYFLERHAPAALQEARLRWERSREELARFEAELPTTMVMEEMATPRETRVLIRGEYDKPGARVSAGLPEVLGKLPPGEPNNRLGLARWLVQPSNPLTSRVTVNRFWQMLFGAGLVRSVEDFGAQGDWPSHPELLDWLACEFMEPTLINCCDLDAVPQSWDVKHILKTIVMSATYRQSSKVTAELSRRDPDNRLLARGPRVRLPAEIIRDQALHVSGLLVEKVGGPSVKTYQPPGLVKELHGTDEDEQDHGPSLYRRSLYVYWKRTVAPPGLTTFDAANRETCVVRETRTNTPLQALHLLNDVTYIEAARHLAQRVMAEAATPNERIVHLFRRATCRAPSAHEVEVLVSSLDEHLRHYRQHSPEATKLVQVGESPVLPRWNHVELAAYTALANTVLNLDEVISKE